MASDASRRESEVVSQEAPITQETLPDAIRTGRITQAEVDQGLPLKDTPLPKAFQRQVVEVASGCITQENLPQALADGRITQGEVEAIWRDTEQLSPQTPIEVRQAVRALGGNVTPAEMVIMQTTMDLRAALYRDESKFAHLVAGTETIVDRLQHVNKLELLVERLETRLNETNLLVGAMVEMQKKSPKAKSLWKRIKHAIFHDGDDEMTLEDMVNRLADGVQPGVEEDYDPKIGSNWDPKNPRVNTSRYEKDDPWPEPKEKPQFISPLPSDIPDADAIARGWASPPERDDDNHKT